MTSPHRPPGRPLPLLVLAAAALMAAPGCAHGPSAKEREGAEIHYQLGADALRGGRREEALHEMDEALKLDPNHAPAHLGRGVALQFSGRLVDAEAEYRKALALDPKLSDGHNALGQLLAQTGRHAEALAEFDRALEDPAYAQAFLVHCNKGAALESLGRREEAMSEVRSCVSLSPRYCRGHRELARMQLEAGQLKPAIGSFNRYAELCPREPDAWNQLGLAELKAGELEKARDAFERCAEIAGDLSETCRAKAETLR